jgi:hypothetical protein
MVSREAPGPGTGGFGRAADGGVGAEAAGGAGLVAARFAPLCVDFVDDARTGFLAARLVAARAFADSRLEELTPELPDAAHRVRERLEGHHRSGPRR